MRTLFLALSFAIMSFAQAAEEVPPGELRSELFKLARPAIEKTAGEAVKFKGSLKQSGNWAFFLGQIVDAAGEPIRVGEAESSDTAVLWQLKDDEWKVIRAATGFTDVIYLDWPTKFGAPAALFE